ncbi:MAG TPA: hypothetical protein PKA74_16690, partial [Bauldia sp.]|nr:hypothetical protein [Bauldia sp.]
TATGVSSDSSLSLVLGDDSITEIATSGVYHQKIITFGGGTATATVTSSDSSYSSAIFHLAAGQEHITGGSGPDTFSVDSTADLSAGDFLDGGGDHDDLHIQLSDGTSLDLRDSATLQNIEILYLNTTNGTLLVDQAVLADFIEINGQAGATLVTAEATLDLTGRSVSTVSLASSNATGTTFTVDSIGTALQVIGGPGQDILDAPTVTLSQTQRDSIFASGSVEVIRDATGLYGDGGPNTLAGTAAGEAISGGGGDDRITGGGGIDSLAGGPGADTFVYAAPAEGGDTISDFTTGNDRLEFAVAGFAGLSAGALPVDRLVNAAGHAATKAFG